MPGIKIATLCDVDAALLQREAADMSKRGHKVATCRDLRKVLDDKSIDAVVIATPDHWHCLAAVWACQAGKDVYVEKPMSHNLFEGRQLRRRHFLRPAKQKDQGVQRFQL